MKTGEGSSLDYLKQSGLMLHKCLSAPLLALKMDNKGQIVGSFELLPHVITTEMLGTGTDGQAISAPFTNFTEMGIVQSGDTITYRICCVGKSTRSGVRASETLKHYLLFISFFIARLLNY